MENRKQKTKQKVENEKLLLLKRQNPTSADAKDDKILLEKIKTCMSEITTDDFDQRTSKIIGDAIKEFEKEMGESYVNIIESFYKKNEYILEVMIKLEEQDKKLTVINEYSNEACPTCGEFKTKTWNEQILAGDEVETGFLICRNTECVKYNVKIQIN